MRPDLRVYIDATWISMLVVWFVGALGTKRTARSQSSGSRVLHLCFFMPALPLLFADKLRRGPLAWRFAPQTAPLGYTGLILTVVGIAFAIWARLHLGRNWSGTVTIKQDHKLIRTGPYAIVRHPIYAGLALAMLGTAIAVGEVGGLVAVGSALIAMILKFRLEEGFMKEQFGVEYERYKKEVKALIPFIW